jgi:hypothetical protein
MKILKNIILFLYYFFIKIDFYFGIALILAILTRPLSKRKKYRVLSLMKPIFSNDIDEIKKIDSDLQFLSFPRLLLSDIVKKFASDFKLLNDASYYPIMDGTIEQKKIYNAVEKIFRHLYKMLKFDIVFAGNYVYVSQQEFFRAAKQYNIPVIVLYKEGGIMASVNKSKLINENLYKNKKFLGTRILFYNKPIFSRLLEAKIEGIHENNSSVVGIPRLDKYIKSKNKESKKNNITLFAFDPNTKSKNFVSDKNLASDYIKMGNDFMKTIILFCKGNPDFNLIIKTKNDPSSVKQINDLLKELKINALPENIKVLNSGNPFEIISNSDIIAGSLSTTLIEALLMDRPILCPNYFNLNASGFDDMFEDHREIVNYILSYEELSDLLKNSNFKKISVKAKELALEPMIYSLDGKSSERVVKEIIDCIESSKNNNN